MENLKQEHPRKSKVVRKLRTINISARTWGNPEKYPMLKTVADTIKEVQEENPAKALKLHAAVSVSITKYNTLMTAVDQHQVYTAIDKMHYTGVQITPEGLEADDSTKTPLGHVITLGLKERRKQLLATQWPTKLKVAVGSYQKARSKRNHAKEQILKEAKHMSADTE